MIELEDRLRTMYVAVADALGAGGDPPGEVPVHRTELRATTRRAQWLGAAAAAVLIVVGLEAVVRREPNPTDVPPLADRPYAIPFPVPEGMVLLRAEVSEGGIATLLWSLGDQMLQVQSGHPSSSVPAGSLARLTSTNAVVEVSGPLPMAETAETVISSLWFVTPEVFAEVTSRAGFTTGRWDSWTPPGAATAISIEGSLQTGLTLSSGIFGFGAPLIDLCVPLGGLDESGNYLVMSAPPAAMRVTMGTDYVQVVRGASPPGLPSIAIAGVTDPSPDPSKRLPLSCESDSL